MLDRSRDIRVFVALLIPGESRAVLSGTIGRLQTQVPTGVKWVDPQGIHLTLKFFGNINSAWKEPVLEAMGDVGRQAAPFDLALSSLGVFPNERQPRVLWSGVNGDMEALGGLQEEVEQAMLALGFRREKRRFNPHLTIGRVRNTHRVSAERLLKHRFFESSDPIHRFVEPTQFFFGYSHHAGSLPLAKQQDNSQRFTACLGSLRLILQVETPLNEVLNIGVGHAATKSPWLVRLQSMFGNRQGIY